MIRASSASWAAEVAWRECIRLLFIYLFIYSLIACNRRVMAILPKKINTKQER
jgi:hypothetical protein